MNIQKIRFALIHLSVLFIIFSFVSIAFAQLGGGTVRNTGSSNCPAGQLCNPIGTQTLGDLINKITSAAMKIGIPIATFFIIWSGLKFVMARGNETEVTAAKTMFWWTIIGTAVLLAANVLSSTLGTTIRQVFN